MDLHMLRYQSYKFELRPTGEQLRWMRRIAGCCRFVFNLALATQKDRVETGLAELDFARLSAQLLAWRRQPESIWLADVPMGIVRFATLSDGTFHMPLNSFRRHERALATAQRSMARKTKYSNNWRKEKVRVQRIYVRIGNARRDYLHKISTAISQNHAVVCIEDLKVSAMSQRATRDQVPSVSGKRKLNKAILDQGWFEFRRQLEYKLKWNGGRLIAVSPRNTSITCPRCRHISKENRRSQAEFVCGGCGFQENADLVGALNVLRAGHARLACGETSPAYEALGQEPTDALPQGL